MDRIQFKKSSSRLQFYRKWLDTCTTVPDAENCILIAACDPVLSYSDYLVLKNCYFNSIKSLEV